MVLAPNETAIATNKAEALDLLVSDGFSGAWPEVHGIPHVAIVVTDGQSNSPTNTMTAAAAVHATRPTITVFASIIDNFNLNELQAHPVQGL